MVRVMVSVRVEVADCCIQTAGKSDKMRINHVIKTDQWRSAPLRILSCPENDNNKTNNNKNNNETETETETGLFAS